LSDKRKKARRREGSELNAITVAAETVTTTTIGSPLSSHLYSTQPFMVCLKQNILRC